MTRSRLVVLASSLVVALGSLAAVGALYLDPARAAVGPLPGEALSLPADVTFVMGFDVKRLVQSEFYQRFGKEKGMARPEAFAELEERTGLNPERDLDRVVIAGKGDAAKGPREAGVVMVWGRFDQYKIGRAIETEKKANVTWKKHEGVTDVPVPGGEEGRRRPRLHRRRHAGDGLAGRGRGHPHQPRAGQARPQVQRWPIASLERGEARLDLLDGGGPEPAGQDADLRAGSRRRPGLGLEIQLPALQSLVVTGDLDPALSVEAIGEARDEAAAKNLADVVRGFFALAQLQAGQKPELKELTSAVSVATETNKVRVSARFSYELLESLHPKQTATTPLSQSVH